MCGSGATNILVRLSPLTLSGCNLKHLETAAALLWTGGNQRSATFAVGRLDSHARYSSMTPSRRQRHIAGSLGHVPDWRESRPFRDLGIKPQGWASIFLHCIAFWLFIFLGWALAGIAMGKPVLEFFLELRLQVRKRTKKSLRTKCFSCACIFIFLVKVLRALPLETHDSETRILAVHACNSTS